MPNLDVLDLSMLGPVIIFVLLWGAMEKWHSYRIESLRRQEREAERQLLTRGAFLCAARMTRP